MVGWHHRLNGHEFEQTLGDGEGQGTLACCSPWGHKESNMTEQLNNSNRMSDVNKIIGLIVSTSFIIPALKTIPDALNIAPKILKYLFMSLVNKVSLSIFNSETEFVSFLNNLLNMKLFLFIPMA